MKIYLNIESAGDNNIFTSLINFPEFWSNQRLATVPASVFMNHDVVLTGHQLVSVTVLTLIQWWQQFSVFTVMVYLAKSIDIRSYCVGRAYQVQGTPLPGCNKTLLEDNSTFYFQKDLMIWIELHTEPFRSIGTLSFEWDTQFSGIWRASRG